jgi:hypothetical protein
VDEADKKLSREVLEILQVDGADKKLSREVLEMRD